MKSHFQPIKRHRRISYLFLTPLRLSRDNVMAPVLTDCADSADTHLICSTEELQGLLVLRADLPVQVYQRLHQLVPFECGRFVVGLRVLLAVGRQTVETGLHSLQFLPRAEVTGDVARPGVDVPLGGVEVEGQPALLDLLSHHAQGGVGPQHRPLGECDLALGANVNPCVVCLVPVATDAVHTETVATGDSHRVPQKVQAQGAVEVIWRSVISHCDGPKTQSDLRKQAENAKEQMEIFVECAWEPALKIVVQPARDRTYLYF